MGTFISSGGGGKSQVKTVQQTWGAYGPDPSGCSESFPSGTRKSVELTKMIRGKKALGEILQSRYSEVRKHLTIAHKKQSN